jgi:prepilin-type N-terminal cleavage/methylation domain-containing protein
MSLNKTIRGFTLLEVLVSLTILALVFTGSLVAINESIHRFDYITKKTFLIFEADAILTQYKVKVINLPKDTKEIYQDYTSLYNPKGSWRLIREADGVRVKIFNQQRQVVYELKAHE